MPMLDAELEVDVDSVNVRVRKDFFLRDMRLFKLLPRFALLLSLLR